MQLILSSLTENKFLISLSHININICAIIIFHFPCKLVGGSSEDKKLFIGRMKIHILSLSSYQVLRERRQQKRFGTHREIYWLDNRRVMNQKRLVTIPPHRVTFFGLHFMAFFEWFFIYEIWCWIRNHRWRCVRRRQLGITNHEQKYLGFGTRHKEKMLKNLKKPWVRQLTNDGFMSAHSSNNTHALSGDFFNFL